MQMNRLGRVQYIDPGFDDKSIVQGFTTRHEGISRPPYNSLNLGMNTDDSPHNVEGNRSILARAFGIPHERLVTVRQTHSCDILAIDEANEDYSHFLEIEADAIITNQPGVMIGVTTADCVPLLLLDPVNRVIAAVHAGWQGTASRITEAAVQAMQSIFKSRPRDIRASIGPCISPCCYEVDITVKEGFDNHNTPWEPVAEASGQGKWRLDMALANRIQLEEAGVPCASIQTSGLCVCCHRELFFSYRRDAGDTGRQIGFTMLKEN